MTEPPYSWSSPTGDPAPAPGGYPPPLPPMGPQYGQPAWLQPGVIPLRPLALGEILDGAMKVIRRYPKPTLGLSAAIAVVVTALNVAAVLLVGRPRLGPSFPEDGGPPEFDSGQAAEGLAAILPVQAIGFVAGLVLAGMLVVVVGRAVRGQPASAGEVWAQVRPRFWALLGLSLLSGLIIGAPIAAGVLLAAFLGATAGVVTAVLVGAPVALAGVAAGVYLYVRLVLATPALVLEKAGIRQSLTRSGVLVKGSWWRLFGILLLTLVISMVVSGIVAVPLGLLAGALLVVGDAGDTPLLVAQQVAGGLASVLIAPFSAAVHALLYVDRRMRAEGLDVALRASVEQG